MLAAFLPVDCMLRPSLLCPQRCSSCDMICTVMLCHSSRQLPQHLLPVPQSFCMLSSMLRGDRMPACPAQAAESVIRKKKQIALAQRSLQQRQSMPSPKGSRAVMGSLLSLLSKPMGQSEVSIGQLQSEVSSCPRHVIKAPICDPHVPEALAVFRSTRA